MNEFIREHSLLKVSLMIFLLASCASTSMYKSRPSGAAINSPLYQKNLSFYNVNGIFNLYEKWIYHNPSINNGGNRYEYKTVQEREDFFESIKSGFKQYCKYNNGLYSYQDFNKYNSDAIVLDLECRKSDISEIEKMEIVNTIDFAGKLTKQIYLEVNNHQTIINDEKTIFLSKDYNKQINVSGVLKTKTKEIKFRSIKIATGIEANKKDYVGPLFLKSPGSNFLPETSQKLKGYAPQLKYIEKLGYNEYIVIQTDGRSSYANKAHFHAIVNKLYYNAFYGLNFQIITNDGNTLLVEEPEFISIYFSNPSDLSDVQLSQIIKSRKERFALAKKNKVISDRLLTQQKTKDAMNFIKEQLEASNIKLAAKDYLAWYIFNQDGQRNDAYISRYKHIIIRCYKGSSKDCSTMSGVFLKGNRFVPKLPSAAEFWLSKAYEVNPSYKHYLAFNKLGKFAWSQRFNYNISLSLGDQVCSFEDNKMGHIDALGDNAHKVQWRFKAVASDGFWFGHADIKNIDIEGTVLVRSEEIMKTVWVNHSEIAGCNFTNHNKM